MSVGDDVYTDRNRNGVRDSGERGIPNATVTVIGADGKTRTATTDGNGKYIVSCIPKGTYTVKVSGVDSKSKPTSPVELSSFVLNATRLDADFGFDMSSVLGFELDRPDAEAAPAVAFTGSSTISMLRTISWLLALGGAIVLVATRRRRHDSSARPAA